MESVQVASGRQRFTIEANLLRLSVLVGGGIIAIARGNAMILVLTLGLVEAAVYLFGLFRMARLHEIRWGRERSIGLTIGAGFVIGTLASMAGKALFPHL